MLTKNNDISIPFDNPFVNDQLERKKIVENLSKLIYSTKQSFVISLEAPWGFGKTTFIRMWKSYLESKGNTCIYFNAWETDFVEDPLISFVGEISKFINDRKSNSKIKSQLRKLQDVSGKIAKRVLPITIQIATQGVLSQDSVKKFSEVIFSSSDEVAGFFSELAKEKILQYENDKKGIDDFKQELEKFAALVVDEAGENKSPLVIFIDELDRCNPVFALALLERIKHFFSVNGIVFVLGIDRRQLEYSAQSVYGQKMEVDGYLRKFIDYSYKLPTPTNEAFARYLFDKFDLGEFVSNELKNLTIRTFSRLANVFNFSLRVQEQCFTEINLVLRTSRKGDPKPIILAFLVTLRAHKQDVFNKLNDPFSFTVNEILDLFIATKQGTEFIFSDEGTDVQSALIADVIPSQEKLSWMEDYRNRYLKTFVADADYEERLKNAQRWTRGSIKFLLNRLAFIEDFVVY